MCVVCNTNCDEWSEAWNARVCKVWESKVRAWESEREHGRAKSNNVVSRVRDEVQSLEMRSESQWGSERCGVKFYLFFLYVQESIYIMWNFKMKRMLTDKFYHLYKGPEAHTKVQPSKLPYPAHNACCALAWSLWYLWIAGPMKGWSGMLMWPCKLISWHTDALGNCVLNCGGAVQCWILVAMR